ncbi:MAG: penicillin-binding protein activator LpoB [Syntrophales bacterium]|nr:penicillin-binding protein activator LpoB [Syntrophales bacterium]
MVISAILFSACGYHSVKEASVHRAPHIRKIYVEPVVNKTNEAYIENTIKSAFIEWLIKGGIFQVVACPEEADAVLEIKIVDLKSSTLSQSTSNYALEERLHLTLDVKLKDRSKGEIIWSNPAFQGTADYFAVTLSEREIARSKSISKLATDIAERAYQLMTFGF